MPLETAVHITDLVVTNPANSDGLNQADDHLRMIKSVLLTDIGNAMVSKKLAVVDGTSGAPSIGFSADATAGLYRSGTGILGITGSLIGQGSVDIGFIGIWPTATAPTGYLACDGQAVSRTTYAALFAKIGTTWGVGDGSTTFNLPPLNSRFLRHREVAGAAGAVGTLQASQNLTHTHTGSGTSGVNSADHTHVVTGTTGSMNQNSTHSHTYLAPSQGVGTGTTPNYFYSGSGTLTATSVANVDHQHPFTTTSNGASATHTHPFSFTSSNGSADGAEARPLSATVLFCIRAL